MNFSIGLSALQASQMALDTIAHNIANANNEGFHRQRIELGARAPQWLGGQYIGRGVDIGRIDRLRHQVIEGSYTNSLSDLASVSQDLAILRQIETEFLPGNGSIHQALSGFFTELTRLSNTPSESVARSNVIQQAQRFASQTHKVASRLNELKSNVYSQIQTEVNALNHELAELVSLQQRIQVASVQGPVPNDLYDQRDQLVNRIALRIDITRLEHVQDGFGLSLAGSAISLGNVPVKFQTVVNSDGSVAVQLANSERTIQFQSGTISALVDAHNTTIGRYQSRLNELTGSFIRQVDQAHATGIGIDGPFDVLRSARKFASATATLEQAGLAFPVSAGDLFISVTDSQGERRTHVVSIDPAVDTLQSVAAKISALSNLKGVVDPINNQFSIIAQPGYRFDFTGSLETIPDLASFGGDSVPRISGQYQGDTNRQLAVTILGSGTIGKTVGLKAQITDLQSGLVIAELNIGDGYEAGKELRVSEGVMLSFAAGQVIDGDSFQTHLVAKPDTTGILSALGLNSLFSGRNATDIAVTTRILEDPRLLATSRTGDWADTTNLAGMLKLQDLQNVGDPPATFQDYLNLATSEIGFEVRSQQSLGDNIQAISRQYKEEIASASGVDLNEEMINMAKYQKQYEAAVQVLQTIDTMLSELMNLIR